MKNFGKTLILGLAIMFFAISGIFIACDNDKYADMKISVVSVEYASTGQAVEYDSNEGCYVLYYNDNITVSCKATCSADISSALLYRNYNESSLQATTNSSTSMALKATVPSRGEKYRITVYSVESQNGSLDLYFKVLLPVTEIDVVNNLALTKDKPIDFSEVVSCSSSYGASQTLSYEVDEKGLDYEVSYYKDNSGDTFDVVTKNNVENVYYVENSNTPAFSFNNGVLNVLDDSLEGKVGVTVMSEKYDKDLDANLAGQVSDEARALIAKNNKLKSEREVALFKTLSLDDITFSSSQTVFDDCDGDLERDVKLSAMLYKNSTATYSIGANDYSYNYETVSVKVNSRATFTINAVSGAMSLENNTLRSDSNVYTVTRTDGAITSSNNSIDSRTYIFKFIANEAGTAYIDFEIVFDFGNEIVYKFSDLYAEYLQSLETEDYNDLLDYQKYTKLALNVSALPVDVVVAHNDVTIASATALKIYDSYGSSEYGVKMGVDLNCLSGTLDSNKIVRVYLSDRNNTGDTNVNNFFEIRNSLGVVMALGTVEKDGVDVRFFDLDLSKEVNKTFYIKASSSNLIENEVYNLSFENIISTNIICCDGQELPEEDSSLVRRQKNYTLSTVTGVSNIVAMTKAYEGAVVSYYYVDNTHNASENALYQDVILQLNTSSNANASSGTAVACLINRNLTSEVNVAYDSVALKVFKLDSSYYTNFSGGYSSSELQMSNIFSIVGSKLGDYRLTFTAENGYTVYVNVKVVNAFGGYTIETKNETKNSDGESCITEKTLNDGVLDNHISMKVNGAFDLSCRSGSDSTGIIGTPSYVSSDATKISVDNGRVSAIATGQVTITMAVEYYVFTTNADGFKQWQKNAEGTGEKTINVVSFIPAKVTIDKRTVSVYDYNSLGIDYKERSEVSINLGLGENATIGLPENVENCVYLINVTPELITYLPSAGDGLNGINFLSYAFLKTGEDYKEVVLNFVVEDFGKVTQLDCVVKIYRAVKIEDIAVSCIKDEQPVSMDKYSGDGDYLRDSYYTAVEEGEVLSFIASISLTNPLIDDLMATVYLANEDKSLGLADSEHTMASLSYRTNVNQAEITLADLSDSNGSDNFSLTINEDSGYFYLIIYAKDGITSRTATTVNITVYVSFLIHIVDGSLENCIEIYNAEDLANISRRPELNYVLHADITLDTWTPIANFTGTLNGYNAITGKYYKIYGLKINRVSGQNIGLFETINLSEDGLTYGAVLNLQIEDAYINLEIGSTSIVGAINIGAIAGTNDGLIMNCAVSFDNYTVSLSLNNANIGGMVGINNGVIYNFGNGTGDSSSTANIVGNSSVTETTNIFNRYRTSVPKKDNISSYGNLEATPVSGTMTVNDASGDATTGSANVGGMVGLNTKTINGLYGIYNRFNEIQSSSKYTTYQTSNVDVDIKINYGTSAKVGSIVNDATCIGGVAGTSTGRESSIANVSVQGYIGSLILSNSNLKGAKNNVGGVVGLTDCTDADYFSSISNVLANVKVRGNNNVGGVVGSSTKTILSTIRVENYSNNNASDSILVAGNNNVGGVVGQGITSSYNLVYSYSYVNKYNTNYITYGDVYAYGASPIAGGIGGSVSTNLLITYAKGVFSNFNINTKATSAGAKLAGLFGMGDPGPLEAFYYVGAISPATDNTVDPISTTETTKNGYYFYYLLGYRASSGENIDMLYAIDGYSYDPVNYDAMTTDYFGTSRAETIEFRFYVENEGVYEATTVAKHGLMYKLENADTTYYNFLKAIPGSITVVGQGTAVTADENGIYALPFYEEGTMTKVKYYNYSYVNGSSDTIYNMIINLDNVDNTLSLDDLFTVNSSLSGLNRLNILVTSSDDSIASITKYGELLIKKIGNVVLTFSLREDNSISATINVSIIKNFDDVLISSSINFTDSYFTEDNSPIEVPKGQNVNVISALVEEVAHQSSGISYLGDSSSSMVAISDSSMYTVNYTVSYYDTESLEYIVVTNDAEYFVRSNNLFKFVKEGNYRIVFNISFTVGGRTFVIDNSFWTFNISSSALATEISFTGDEITLIGNQIVNNIQIILTSSAAMDINYYVEDSEGNRLDETSNPFSISISDKESARQQGNSFYYDVRLYLLSNFRYVQERKTYTIYIYDEFSALINDPGELTVYVEPQAAQVLNTVHYAYTDVVSELANVTDSNQLNNNTHYYSFTNNPTNTVVAGSEGLFIIDLYPYYANITSVELVSSLGDSGDAMQFIQMVAISSNSSSEKYYINGPTTRQLANGGISLNLVSYVPSSVATLVVNPNSTILSPANATLSYAFGESNDVGRLYVKTLTPSTISSNSSFTLTITVKYNELNSEGVLVEKTANYPPHTLNVGEMPGFSLKVDNNGIERNVIAFTGQDAEISSAQDYLILTPQIQGTYKKAEIQFSVYNGAEQLDQDSGCVLLESQSDGTTKLTLAAGARVGYAIHVSLLVSVQNDETLTTKSYTVIITVVDVVIESIHITGVDENQALRMSVHSAKKLQVYIEGYGLNTALTEAENNISRGMSGDSSVIFYWYVYGNDGINTNPLSYSGIQSDLPFTISTEIEGSDEGTQHVTVDSSCLGAKKGQNEYQFDTSLKVIVLTAFTTTQSLNMLLSFSYVYKEGEIVFIPNDDFETDYTVEQDFSIIVTQGADEENLSAIYDEDDLRSMEKNGNYILMSDIVIDRHTAIDVDFASFDGNNKIITIKEFAYSTNLNSSETHTLNMGLFGTVSSSSTIKNVIVALPNDNYESASQDGAMDLTDYSTVNFGGIACINNGLITNCDVITIKDTVAHTIAGVTLSGYTLDIQTDTSSTVNVGGLVAINNSTGIITNSRVGREEVTVLEVSEAGNLVSNPVTYEATDSKIILKVSGRGNVGGFVSSNSGTISSSYARNLQMEVSFTSASPSDNNPVKTAGFVVNNNGYIYGSYSAGWEESSSLASSSISRKLGGGIFSNGAIAGFVYNNEHYIEDCYSNINLSGSYTFAANTTKVYNDKTNSISEAVSPYSSGFVLLMGTNSYIYTSYSLSKINAHSAALNTHGAFEGTHPALISLQSASLEEHPGEIESCYFMKEGIETFNSEYERAQMLSDSPVSDEDGANEQNEFINTNSFNGFSFDNYVDSENNFDNILNNNTGGVWAIHMVGTGGYPDLISANKVSISCRVISNINSVRKFVYVTDYEIGSARNPYLVSSFKQYNDLFKEASGENAIAESVSSKFTDNIRLINNINFAGNTNVYSTTVEYTSRKDDPDNKTTVFDGNYLSMYNILLNDSNVGKYSFGLFRDIYNAAVKNLTLGISGITASNSISVGGLAGVIVDSNISNITLVSSSTTSDGKILGKSYVGGLAGIVISSTAETFYTISKIKSNLSVTANSEAELSSTITSSFSIWNAIQPRANASGLSVSGNLLLGRLPSRVSYAGGIAGVIDLHQSGEEDDTLYSITEANAINIHVRSMVENSSVSGAMNYSKAVEVLSFYTGGLFGFIGSQTYLTCSDFVVTSSSKLTSYQVAGGIAAINYGKINKACVSYNESDLRIVDNNIVDYVSGGEYEANLNTILFSGGTPKYIGGLVGINAGCDANGSGSIENGYNRVDVKNDSAIAVGGIVGASYVGELKNVYTTASLMGNISESNTSQVYIGGIIGQIFDTSSSYFREVTDSESRNLHMENIVALNTWSYSESDFNRLFTYVSSADTDHVIGALYGKYENNPAEGDDGIVDITTEGIYVQRYIVQNYENSYFQTVGTGAFDVTQLIDPENSTVPYIQLWGTSITTGSKYYDSYLRTNICQNDTQLIDPNEYRDLFTVQEGGQLSSFRSSFFSVDKWKRSTWNYDDEYVLPILKFGYESSLVRIYTASQFFAELNSADTLGKIYIVMNDIDFENCEITPISYPFRGTLYGNDVTYTDNNITYTRKAILYNLNFAGTALTNSSYALFLSTQDASISDLNFVISSYTANYNYENSNVAKQSAILVATAVNTMFNNIHIYDSLTAPVATECSNYDFGSNSNYTVTQGLNVNAGVVTGLSVGFLKLCTLDSTSSSSSGNSYYFTLDSNTFSLTSAIRSGGDGSVFSASELSALSADAIDVTTCSGLNTNANIVGALVADSNSSILTISSCSTNLDINITYNIKNVLSKYVGGLLGNAVCRLAQVYCSSSITILKSYLYSSSYDMDSMYVGGLGGLIKGTVESVYVKNVIIQVGEANNNGYIYASKTTNGFYIGGVIGSVSKYTNSNGNSVGNATDINVSDLSIKAYIKGSADIAGAIGSSSFAVSEVVVKQSTTYAARAIEVTLYDSSDKTVIVGGVIAENSADSLSEVYSNISINVMADVYENLIVGGIVGKANIDCTFESIKNDANSITVSRVKDADSYYVLNTLYVGGIFGKTGSTNSKIIMDEVISSTDIIVDQEKTMYVGGFVGEGATLTVRNVISLGNITLKRGVGTSSGSYFYMDSGTTNSDISYNYYIGGLIGSCANYIVDATSKTGALVASTIRDYAIAQKLSLNIGAVIGGVASVQNQNNKKTYYNENTSLVSCDGYNNNEFKNITQSSLVSYFKEIYDEIIKTSNFESTYDSNYYSKLFTLFDYTDYSIEDDITAVAGSKLNPINFVSGVTIEANKYYLTSSDLILTNSVTTAAENWVINAQGYSIVAIDGGTYKPAFYNIPNGAVVSSVMVSLTEDVVVSTSYAPIARSNSGFIFSCGTGGNITGNAGVSSLVVYNSGVISTCFSIANITANSGAGFVVYNQKEGASSASELGNIYNSYFTGLIKATESTNTGSIFSGFTIWSTYGVISNCYTMADVDAANRNVNAIIDYNSGDYENLYRTYYDYTPASFGEQEGVNVVNVDLTDNTDCISSKGYYCKSTVLSGSTSNPAVSALTMFTTDWITIDKSSATNGNDDDNQQLYDMFMSSTYYKESVDKVLHIEPTWFNYGYISKNLLNIICPNKMKTYFDMIYTGNGLGSYDDYITLKNDVTLQNSENVPNGFINMPYSIKHAGLLESLVSANCGPDKILPAAGDTDNNTTTIKYRYYRLIKDISFAKYSGTDYWSLTWDEKNIYFVGDLDGKNYTNPTADNPNYIIHDMYSSNGLLRALPSVEGVNNVTGGNITTVRNITFKECYSKTGLVAGYMGSGVISNIFVKSSGESSIVYNGDITDVCSAEFVYGDGAVPLEFKECINSVTYSLAGTLITKQRDSVAFAGGLVGFMDGGSISDGESTTESTNFNGLKVVVSDYHYTCVSYAGGLVGIMTGGSISGTEDNLFEISDVSVYSCINKGDIYNTTVVSNSTIGGVVGLLASESSTVFGRLSYITNTKAKLYGFSTMGGIAGFVNGGQVLHCQYNNPAEDGMSVANVKIQDRTMSYTNAATTVTTNAFNDRTGVDLRNLVATEIYAGGIAGKFQEGTIDDCEYGSNSRITITIIRLAGYHSIIFGGIVGDMYELNSKKYAIINDCRVEGSATIKSVLTSIAGGVVGRMRGGTITNCQTAQIENSYATFSAKVAYDFTRLWQDPDGIIYTDNGYIDISNHETTIQPMTINLKQLLSNFLNDGDWFNFTVNPTNPVYETSEQFDTSYSGKTSGYVKMSIGANLSSHPTSVAGGIVGKMFFGTLDGGDLDSGDTAETATSTITNKLHVYANSSAGGIVGEVIAISGSETKKCIIHNVKNYGRVEGFSAYDIDLTVGAEAFVGYGLSENASGVVELNASIDLSEAFSLGVALDTCAAGGIVGYIYSSTKDSINHSVVEVTDCFCAGSDQVGGILATFVGGIVGLASSAETNGHVIIENCISEAVLAAYPIRSFAGGIVGYLCYATVKNCVYASGLIELISTELNSPAFEDLLAFPYITGGIVGYLQQGLVEDCNTQMLSMLGAFRVAGGIIGVMAGGRLKSNSIMYNGSVVFSMIGAAGGIVGVITGGVIETVGDVSFSSMINNVTEISNQIENNESIVEIFENLSDGAGIMVNLPTGIIIGVISGGIIGSYSHMLPDTTKGETEPSLTGVLNLGSVYSGISMIVFSEQVNGSYTANAGGNDGEGGFSLAKLGELMEQGWDWVNKNILSYITGGWELTISIDGTPLTALSLNFLKGTTLDLGDLIPDFITNFVSDAVGLSGYTIKQYVSDLVIPNFAWSPTYGLTYPGWTADGDNEEAAELRQRYNFELKNEDFRSSAGQSCNGGIVGLIKTSDKLTVSFAISYAVVLGNNSYGSSALDSITTGRIAGPGSAGGLIGASIGSDLLITLCFNFTSVVGGRTGGGIIGYADSGVKIITAFETDMTSFLNGEYTTENGGLRGYVINFAAVNAVTYAGGIVGYSAGASLNTEEAENFYAAHTLSLSLTHNGKTIIDDSKASLTTASNIEMAQRIINSGSVFGAVYSGGLVGYAESTQIRLSSCSQNILSELGDALDVFSPVAFYISATQYSGGLVGMMNGGVISATCSVANTKSTIPILAMLQKKMTILAKSSSVDIPSYAGGIVGVFTSDAQIGGSWGNPGAESVGYVAVNDLLTFGLRTNYADYVGGIAGLLTERNTSIYVDIRCEVTGGEIAAGGLYGCVDIGMSDNPVMDFNADGTGVEGMGLLGGRTDLDMKVSGIEDASPQTEISGKYCVGGIIGELKSGTIKNVTIISEITGGTNCIVGGAIGRMVGGNIEKITVVREEMILGNYSIMDKCDFIGTSNNDTYALGGIVGFMADGTISNSYVTELVLSGAEYVGGVVGIMRDGDIGTSISSECSNQTIVIGGFIGKSIYAGGIVGYMSGGTISAAISRGVYYENIGDSVTESEIPEYVGGFVGVMSGDAKISKEDSSSGGGEGSGGEGESEDLCRFSATGTVRLYGKYVVGGAVAKIEEEATFAAKIYNINAQSVVIKSGTTAREGGDEIIPTVGGLVGIMEDGNVVGGIAPDVEGVIVGGIVGRMSGGVITNAEAGKVTTVGEHGYAGGLVGQMISPGTSAIDPEIEGVTSREGSIVTTGSGASDCYLGGLVGYMSGGEFANGTNAGALPVDGKNAENSYGGGAIGYATTGSADLENNEPFNVNLRNMSTSTVKGVTYAGGIVGCVENAIISAVQAEQAESNTETMVLGNEAAGAVIGFAGHVSGSEGEETISRVTLAVSTVNSIKVEGKKYVGGVIGAAENSEIFVQYSVNVNGDFKITDSAETSGIGGLIGNNINALIGTCNLADIEQAPTDGNQQVTIANLKLDMSDSNSFGIIAGRNLGKIVYMSGIITADSVITVADEKIKNFGGVAGINDKTEDNDAVSGTLYHVSSSISPAGIKDESDAASMNGDNFGGIVGNNKGLVEACSIDYDILSPEYTNIGGIAGTSSGEIKYCIISSSGSTKKIQGAVTSNVGGIAGSVSGSAVISNHCANNATVELVGEDTDYLPSYLNINSETWESAGGSYVLPSNDQTYTSASAFKEVHSGSVGGIVGMIDTGSEAKVVGYADPDKVFGYCYYKMSETEDESMSYKDEDVSYPLEIVDRRGTIVGLDNSDDKSFISALDDPDSESERVKYGSDITMGYSSDTNLNTIIDWSSRDEELDPDQISKIAGYRITKHSIPEGGSETVTLHNSYYGLFSTEGSANLFDAVSLDDINNANGGKLAAFNSTINSAFASLLVSKLSIIEVGIEPTAASTTCRSQMTSSQTTAQNGDKTYYEYNFYVVDITTTHQLKSYTVGQLQDVGGDVTYTRNAKLKEVKKDDVDVVVYETEVSARASALKELYNLSSEDVGEDELYVVPEAISLFENIPLSL